MDPIDVQTIQELETLQNLWKLAVWFIAVSWPILSGLIVFFYNRGEKWRDAHVEYLKKENEILKMKQQ